MIFVLEAFYRAHGSRTKRSKNQVTCARCHFVGLTSGIDCTTVSSACKSAINATVIARVFGEAVQQRVVCGFDNIEHRILIVLAKRKFGFFLHGANTNARVDPGDAGKPCQFVL